MALINNAAQGFEFVRLVCFGSSERVSSRHASETEVWGGDERRGELFRPRLGEDM